MTPRIHHRQTAWLIAAGALTVLISLVLVVFPASAQPPVQETEKFCLDCHGDPTIKPITLPSGEELSLYIEPEGLHNSVHRAVGIECEACHNNISGVPHPPIEYQTHRELSLSYYKTCEKCHSANYDKTLDSMHARALEAGNQDAPVCTDCHGAHDIRPPDQPRSLISETCRQCHVEIVDTYRESVHGSALMQDENPDVPVCTTCHGVHNIQDPRTSQFRVNEPELCAGCHADKELMDKYGLSADVYDIYKRSWHGVDVSVYKARWPTIWHDSAVCSDCHGSHHDIRSTADPASMVNPENLLTTCKKCHPTAGPNWTDAWTGHNKISLERTPWLYYVDKFYGSFTKFTLWVCIIYVALQLFRAVVDRARRSQS
jgi:predicted CXXCH cytochrome family protein